MANIPIQVRNQLTDLGKIKLSQADNGSAIVVDVRIGDLSWKDLKRAMYLVSTSFIELTYKQKVIVDVIKNTQKQVEEALNNKDLSREELELKIRELILEELKPVEIPAVV